MKSGGVQQILAAMKQENAITVDNDTEYIKGPVDTFSLQRVSDAWSMSTITRAITDTVKNAPAEKVEGDDPDKIIDYEKVIKKIMAHEGQPPTAQDTPYFNHDAYFPALEAYISSDRRAMYANLHVGKYLMYGQVVTSTSTLLEKYVSSHPTKLRYTK
jgi:biotin--protein ligase